MAWGPVRRYDSETMTQPIRSSPDSRRSALVSIAAIMVIAALGWFLLKELASVLRPLLMAVILAYVLMPYHSRLRKHVSAPISLVLLASFTVGLLIALALAVQMSVLELSKELPVFQDRVIALVHRVQDFAKLHVPGLLDESAGSAGEQLAAMAAQVAGPVLNVAAAAFVEACVVGLYLLFLLLEASRFPDLIRRAYAPKRADEILHLAGQVNAAIVSYLKAKVRSSLFLAVPVGLVLWSFGVKFSLLWAVLTFLCNFIPYIGSVVAYCLPVGFAFLQLPPGWEPLAVAALLLGCQLISASMIEPMLLGHAVGLSPLVILGSLAFWGLLWGIPGMFLAVPLTVVAVIVMNHFELTRPVSKLMSGGE